VPHDEQELRLSVQRLARRIRSMQADEDVTEGQRTALFALDKLGPQTLGSLSEHQQVRPPSMNRTVNALVEAGLATRETASDDGRKVTIDLSDAGRAFITETKRRRDAWFTKRLAGLSPADREIMYSAGRIMRDLAE
jgi:DNA-binding MarR family transcriptional regulator